MNDPFEDMEEELRNAYRKIILRKDDAKFQTRQEIEIESLNDRILKLELAVSVLMAEKRPKPTKEHASLDALAALLKRTTHNQRESVSMNSPTSQKLLTGLDALANAIKTVTKAGLPPGSVLI